VLKIRRKQVKRAANNLIERIPPIALALDANAFLRIHLTICPKLPPKVSRKGG
jgi:hypothetical protein